MRTSVASLTVTLAVFALLAQGCALPGAKQDSAAEKPAVRRIENPSLGLAVANVPTGFEVAENEGETLRLARTPENSPGTAVIVVGPEERAGVNLVDAVHEQKARIEERTDGRFFGQVELATPWGPAYSTRGRYTTDDPSATNTEEVRLLTIHPQRNSLVSLIYTYPAGGETKARIEHAMELLGEIETLAAEPEAGGDGSTTD